MKTIGKTYSKVECKICRDEYTVCDIDESGIDKETAKMLTNSGFPCKESDNVCMNCILEATDFMEEFKRTKI